MQEDLAALKIKKSENHFIIFDHSDELNEIK